MRNLTTRGRLNHGQTGLSLIELLIAIALGVLLLLGLVQIFSGIRNTFAATESLSRVQENGRFAMEFLRRDTRMAGHLGCRNETWHFPTRAPLVAGPLAFERTTEPAYHNLLVAANTPRDDWYYTLRIDRPVEVYEYTAAATEPGDNYTIASDTPTPVAASGSWTPALPAALDITGDALPGSDVLVVRYLDEEALPAAGSLSGLTAVQVRAADVTAGRYVVGGIYGITDCNISALFQATSIDTSAAPPTLGFNALPNVQRTDAAGTNFYMPQQISIGAGSMLHRYRVVAYYVGQGVEGPALKRRTLLETGYPTAGVDDDITLGPAEEVVEGVEMMQILLGFDERGEGGSTAVKDDSADQYLTANDLIALDPDVSVQDENLRRVVSLRISLLLRGNQGRSGAEGPTTIIVGETRVTPPADGRLREVYETVMSIRNRNRA